MACAPFGIHGYSIMARLSRLRNQTPEL